MQIITDDNRDDGIGRDLIPKKRRNMERRSRCSEIEAWRGSERWPINPRSDVRPTKINSYLTMVENSSRPDPVEVAGLASYCPGPIAEPVVCPNPRRM